MSLPIMIIVILYIDLQIFRCAFMHIAHKIRPHFGGLILIHCNTHYRRYYKCQKFTVFEDSNSRLCITFVILHICLMSSAAGNY